MTKQQLAITGVIDEQAVRLTLEEPTVLSGMVRAIQQSRALEYVTELGVTAGPRGTAMLLVARYLFPDLTALVVAAEGLDVEGLTVADFMALPTDLVDAWTVAAYQLAPQWSLSGRDDDAEKKEEAPNSDKSALP